MAENKEKRGLLERLYDVTITAFKEYMKQENRDKRHIERLVKKINKVDKDTNFYQHDGNLDDITSAKMKAFSYVLLNERTNGKYTVEPMYYAELFSEVYNKIQKNKVLKDGESQSLKLDDVGILQMAIDYLLKEPEFSDLQKGAKYKALTFWNVIKDCDNLSENDIECAKDLFEKCYNNKSNMNVFEDVLDSWNGTYVSASDYDALQISEKARLIKESYQKNQSLDNLNPLLLENPALIPLIKDVDEILETNFRKKHFKSNDRQELLKSFVTFFRENPEQYIEFHKMFTNLNKISNKAIKENLKTIILLKVLKNESLNGVRIMIDSVNDKPALFNGKNQSLNDKNFDILLSFAKGKVLSNPKAKLDMLKDVNFLDGNKDVIQEAVNKAVILIETNKMKSSAKKAESKAAIEKVRRDFLYPGYNLSDINCTEKYSPISTRIRQFIIKQKPMDSSGNILGKEKEYIVKDIKTGEEKQLSASEIRKKYRVNDKDDSLLAAFGYSRNISQKNLDTLNESDEYNIRAVNEAESGYFCHIVPRFAEAEFNNKNCDNQVIICKAKSNKSKEPDLDTAEIMSKTEFEERFNTEKLTARLSDTESDITFEQAGNLLNEIKHGYAKLVLLSYEQNDLVLDGLSATGVSLEKFGKNENAVIRDCVVNKAYSFAYDYEKDMCNISNFSEKLMRLTQMMQKQGVPEKTITEVIDSCHSLEEMGAMLTNGETLSRNKVYGQSFASEIQKARQEFLSQTYYCDINKDQELKLIEFEGDSVRVINVALVDVSDAAEYTEGCQDFYSNIIESSKDDIDVYKKGSSEYEKVCNSIKNADAAISKNSIEDRNYLLKIMGCDTPINIQIETENVESSISSPGVYSVNKGRSNKGSQPKRKTKTV